MRTAGLLYSFCSLSLTHTLTLTAQYLSVQGLIDRQKQCCVDKAESVACDGVVVTYSDVQAALRSVRPSAMREVAIEVPKVGEKLRKLHMTIQLYCMCLYTVVCFSFFFFFPRLSGLSWYIKTVVIPVYFYNIVYLIAVTMSLCTFK